MQDGNITDAERDPVEQVEQVECVQHSARSVFVFVVRHTVVAQLLSNPPRGVSLFIVHNTSNCVVASTLAGRSCPFWNGSDGDNLGNANELGPSFEYLTRPS